MAELAAATAAIAAIGGIAGLVRKGAEAANWMCKKLSGKGICAYVKDKCLELAGNKISSAIESKITSFVEKKPLTFTGQKTVEHAKNLLKHCAERDLQNVLNSNFADDAGVKMAVADVGLLVFEAIHAIQDYKICDSDAYVGHMTFMITAFGALQNSLNTALICASSRSLSIYNFPQTHTPRSAGSSAVSSSSSAAPEEIQGVLEFIHQTGNYKEIQTAGQLLRLTRLELNCSNLKGEIPSGISKLTKLEVLNLRFNQLIGSIPSGITKLTALKYLHLQGNKLSGSIPSGICNLTSLKHLSLHTNQLTGEIPSGISNLTALTHLWLNINNLTGQYYVFFSQSNRQIRLSEVGSGWTSTTTPLLLQF